MVKKGQIDIWYLSLLPPFLSFSTSIYVILKFLPFTNLGALVMSVMACLWSSLLASFKSGYFFGLKVGKKGFSRLTLYLLVFSFFVFYQSFFAREGIIVFAQTTTTTIDAGAWNPYWDINGNNEIDQEDLDYFAGCFYLTTPECAYADWNHDGIVNMADIGPVAAALGATQPPRDTSTVPPTTVPPTTEPIDYETTTTTVPATCDLNLNLKDKDLNDKTMYYYLKEASGVSVSSGMAHNISHKLSPGTYDILLFEGNIGMDLTISCNVALSGNIITDRLNPTDLSRISIGNLTPKVGYGVSVSIPITSATLTLGYSGVTIDENKIKLYKCDNWNVAARDCTGVWNTVTISSTDKVNDIVEFSVSGFSGFVIGDSLYNTVTARGTALNYYTGEGITGNITAIPLENPENKYTTEVVNGEWSMTFGMAENVEHLTFVVEDKEMKGYNEIKLPTPYTAKLNCSTQNISVEGYTVDVEGSSITSGNVIISVPDTDYTNTKTFSGGTWSIDFHPCLISGQVYTLQIMISDNTGKRGEISQKYPAK